jgi:hypothetical protein
MHRFLLALLAFLTVAASPHRYAEGQVWSYATRTGDQGSLLKIQKIESAPDGTRIFHISVIGFRLKKPSLVPMLPHAPVSQQTLDTSVVALRPDPGKFPPADAGIVEWRQAHGGVFSIPVADIIEVLDRTTSQEPLPQL